PALARADQTIHLYGKWVSTQPQTFTVKYFIDNVEQTHLTQTYPLNTSITVMEKMENTATHAYSSWSAPISATQGVSVVVNADGTFTMTEHGEVHIRCTSTPVAPAEKYNVRYYLDDQLYWEGGYELFQRHFILDDPALPGGVYFSGWSVPRTVYGLTVRVLYNGLGKAVITMPAQDVVIHGTTSLAPIPDGTMKIEKVVNAPADFAGGREYTFRIYQLVGDTKILVHTETVKVNAKTGKGDSGYFDLPKGNNYLVEEVGAGVPGYALTTVATDADGNVIPYGATVTVKARITPTVITFTNTYTDLSLETRDHFGYIIGYQDDTVRPEDNITRAEVATIFFRLLTDAKRAEYWSKTNDFTDVSADAWYNNAISTLANAGVLSGYEDNTFRPDQPITRAELVKIAMSFYGTVQSEGNAFNDIGEHWAAAFINGAAEMGFVNGYGDETFQPDRYVTRAEAIKIINRTLNRAPDKDHLLEDMITWVDNADTAAWYYAEIQEATNSHTYTWDKTSEIWEKIRPVRDWAALEKSWSEADGGAK
ncbi:MAG: S-layer homology domain-containing protein, partial [Clostridia bacterium]|nr:S-layer homology domain-containing protein [Clostridia bacterium]